MFDLRAQGLDAASVYTDLQGLGSLREAARNQSPEALQGVARQFEAVFIGMMLDSMRTATATIESAMSGSTTADCICTTPVTASASVSAWATVKALTCQRSGRHDGDASTSALMNSTWSNPRGRMCSKPSARYVENTPACYRGTARLTQALPL